MARNESSRPGGYKLALAIAAVASAAIPESAWASGFALREGSADWIANSFAGETAKA